LGVHGGLGGSPTVWQAEETISVAIVSVAVSFISGLLVASVFSFLHPGTCVDPETLISTAVAAIVGDGGGEY
jgi:hypothetical protein